jgi:hypothetical protein
VSETTTKIDRSQRDPLHRLLSQRLTAITDPA